MRMHRFYINQVISGREVEILNKDQIHQWKKVFRYTTGSKVLLFCGDGVDHEAEFVLLEKNKALLRLHTAKNVSIAEKNMVLALSLLKKENTEFAIQKAVELGVSTFVPIISERSEKKNLNMERAQKIIVEATEQSGRGDIMKMLDPVELKEFLKYAPKDGPVLTKIFFDTKSSKKLNSKIGFPAIVFIGPEGGYSDNELALFAEHYVESYSLGTNILRAETAAIAAASLLLIS